MTNSYSDVFGGNPIYPSDNTYLFLNLTSSVVLDWPGELQTSGNVLADIINVNAGSPGLTITLSDARQVSTGFTTLINNVGVSSITVMGASGTTIVSVSSGTAWSIYLTDNSTIGGTWSIVQFGASVSAVNAAALAGAGLTAIGSTLNVAMTVTSLTSAYSFSTPDRAKLFVWLGGAGNLALPSGFDLGANWLVYLTNDGSGSVVVTPAGCTVDGATTKTFAPGQSAILVSDGTNYFTVGYAAATSASGFDFIAIDISGTGDYTLTGVQLNRVSYRFTGVLTGNRTVIVPSIVQEYWVDNQTTGAFQLSVRTAGQTPPGAIVTSGGRRILSCDGTNVIVADTSTVSLPVLVNQGGTGSTTPSGALINLGGTSLGIALFSAASPSNALSLLGAQSTKDATIFALMVS